MTDDYAYFGTSICIFRRGFDPIQTASTRMREKSLFCDEIPILWL